MTALSAALARRQMRVSGVVAGAVGLVAFLLAWKAIVIVAGYPPYILPAPETVLDRLVSGWTDGTIPRHAATTLLEVALGFGAGATLAVVVGYGLARSALVERLVSPYIVAAQKDHLLEWHRRGVKISFFVQDLLPISMPSCFPEGAAAGHHRG